MSAGGNGGTVGMGAAGDDGDVWVGLGLAEVASGARVGPAPMADIMAGGRRIRRRRRSVVGALALASVVVLGGGTMAGLHSSPASSGSQSLVPANGGPGGGTGGGPAAQPSGSATAERDPLTPVRVPIAQGETPDGKKWQLFTALWPVAPKDKAYEQAVAVWKERHAVDSSLDQPTEEYVQHYWQPNEDVVNDYVTLDGVRQPSDIQNSYPAPGHVPEGMADTFSGALVGARDKAGTPGPLPIKLAVMALGPDVGKVLVTWSDGSVMEPWLKAVGDSPYQRLVVAEQPGKKVTSWQFFDKKGAELPNAGEKMLTE
ncbi:hypothetical protein ACFVTF_15480 [Kitasatospora sp. NPDC057940]|uniref:hypothetical protein n=1 Tax=unclassified Kitasatospora TaxID=2633591 RepID=UPI00352E1FBE|nr:hypothetical protein OG556_26415 [Kitasatospora sp. NBC_01300]